jgi:uncharacterized protein (TIGR02996 family)
MMHAQVLGFPTALETSSARSMRETERALLAALHADPTDRACWLALADCLEELGQLDRAEVLRLRLGLHDLETRGRLERERRMRLLLDKGVCPVVPLLTCSVGLSLALIPAGVFWMGSLVAEPGRDTDENPRHRVEITRSFYLGIHPVTQEQFHQVTGSSPSHFSASGEGAPLVRGVDTADFPVERVSWDDAMAFCRLLSERPEERAAGRVYRLPTEAEWEYACRAGTTTPFHHGESLTADRANIDGNLPEVEVRSGRSLGRTCQVGSYPPNAFGLFDMHGNVWEWCSDWFDEEYYPVSPARDPLGSPTGSRRVLRGGGWFYGAAICRSAYRYGCEPHARHHDFGLRVAMTAG